MCKFNHLTRTVCREGVRRSVGGVLMTRNAQYLRHTEPTLLASGRGVGQRTPANHRITLRLPPAAVVSSNYMLSFTATRNVCEAKANAREVCLMRKQINSASIPTRTRVFIKNRRFDIFECILSAMFTTFL